MKPEIPIVDCGHKAQPSYYTAGSHVTIQRDDGSTYRLEMTGDEVMFPGYATTADGRQVCPACADSLQAQEMAASKPGHRVTLYLSADNRTVTTWTGGVLGRVTRVTRNERQTFVRVVDVDGNRWAGIGPAESGTYVNLRRVKA